MNSQNPLRQKLVSMMYLLLIAMVVFNIPVEFIESFTDLNRTLERANYMLDQRNRRTISTIERFHLSDSARYSGVYNKIVAAKAYSDSAIRYIDTIKLDLITQAEGYENGHLKKALDATLPTRRMIKEGLAPELKGLLVFTKERLLDIMNEREGVLLDTVLDTRDMLPKVIGKADTWENYYFDNVPLAAVVAILTKFQNDLRLAESIALNKFYDQAEMGYNASFIAQYDVRLDTIALEKGVRKFDVFNIGEDGIARVTLPTVPSDAGGQAVIYTYNDEGEVLDSFMFDNGIGEVALRTDQIGEFKIKGVVKYRYPDPEEEATASVQKDVARLEEPEPPKVESYPFEIDYSVVNPKPFLSQGDYNVLYVGINNPLNVYHPEFDRSNYKVDISQGKVIDNGEEYFAQVYRPGFALVTLSVPDGQGGYKKVAQENFKVRELPKPLVTLYNKPGGEIPAKIFKQQKGLETNIEQLPIDSKFKVMEYKVTYINAKGLGIFKENVKGSYFTGKSKELIELAQPGDIYIFEDIYVKGPDGKNEYIEALVFNIN